MSSKYRRKSLGLHERGYFFFPTNIHYSVQFGPFVLTVTKIRAFEQIPDVRFPNNLLLFLFFYHAFRKTLGLWPWFLSSDVIFFVCLCNVISYSNSGEKNVAAQNSARFNLSISMCPDKYTSTLPLQRGREASDGIFLPFISFIFWSYI